MNRKSGLMRTLKYATISAEKVFLVFLIMITAYSAMFIINGEANQSRAVLHMYYIFVCIIMILVLQVTNNTRYLSVSISFGCRRKDALIGTHLINLIIIAQSVIGFVIFVALLPGELEPIKFEVEILFLVLAIGASGFGQIQSAISFRFGKLVGFLVVAFLMTAITGVLIWRMFLMDGIFELKMHEMPTAVWIIAFAVAVGAYVIGAFLNRRVILNYEVRA